MSAIVAPAVMVGSTAAEEARSLLASIVTQLLNIIRTAMAYAYEMIRNFIQWSGEHPLAAILLVTNLAIWVS